MSNYKYVDMHETFNFQAEDECLTEFCASEVTLGAVGEKNEAGFGKYDDDL